MYYDGVPLDLARHLQVDTRTLSETEKKRMNEIYDMSNKDIKEISSLSNKLGGAKHSRGEIDKLWTHLKTRKLTSQR